MGASKLEAVVFAPFFHDLYKVLHLRIVRVLEHLDDFDQSFFALLASDDHLEYANGSTSFALPEFRVWVKALKDAIERVKQGDWEGLLERNGISKKLRVGETYFDGIRLTPEVALPFETLGVPMGIAFQKLLQEKRSRGYSNLERHSDL